MVIYLVCCCCGCCGSSQGPDWCSSCNVSGKRGDREMVHGRGVMMVLVQTLGGSGSEGRL